jgi:hypothetical protein
MTKEYADRLVHEIASLRGYVYDEFTCIQPNDLIEL